MFETVNKRGQRSGRRLSEGAITSILVHVALVIVIVVVSSSDSKSNQKKDIDYSKVTFKDMPEAAPPPPPPPPNLPPPPPPPPPPAAAQVVETPKVPKKPKKQAPVQPNTVVTAPPDPTPAPPAPVTGGVPGGVEGGKEGGVVGGKIGGVEGGVVGGEGTVPSNAVLPFGSGMERPKKLSGRDPEYSREALAAKVEGMMIVRCVIELDGKLQDCKVIKSLPYMEEAVLSALATHRYSPVMFQGRPQRVNYTFNIKLKSQ